MKLVIVFFMAAVSFSVGAEQLKGSSYTQKLDRPFTSNELAQEFELAVEDALAQSKSVTYWLQTSVDGDNVTNELRKFLPVLGHVVSTSQRYGSCHDGQQCLFTEVEIFVNREAVSQTLDIIQSEAKLDDYIEYLLNNVSHPAHNNSTGRHKTPVSSPEYRVILALFIQKKLDDYYRDTLIYIESKTASRTANHEPRLRFEVKGYFEGSAQLEQILKLSFDSQGIEMKRVERMVRQGVVDEKAQSPMNFKRANQLNVSQVCFIPTTPVPHEFASLMAGDTILNIPLPSRTEFVRIGDNDTRMDKLQISDSTQLCFWNAFGLDYYVTLSDRELAKYKFSERTDFLASLRYTIDHAPSSEEIPFVPSDTRRVGGIRLPIPPEMDSMATRIYDSELLIGCKTADDRCLIKSWR